jgi:hypothetical protein
MKLTKEEKEMLDSVERGEWESIPNLEREAVRNREAARRVRDPQIDRAPTDTHAISKSNFELT